MKALPKWLFIVPLFWGSLASLFAAETRVLRVGFFPNITHAQGLIGSSSTREAQGWFEQELGEGVTLEWFAYNAGPSAMEAMLSGSIDLTYVGPNPALNTYIRSKGTEIRLLAGAARGGAALVLRKGLNPKSPEAFKGLRIASPQLGNTQDVAARAHFKKLGLQVTLTGGDLSIIPTANPDQLTLLLNGKLDGAWTVEPWVSRLLLNADAHLEILQDDAVTTLLVSSVKALKDKPELVHAFTTAHRKLTAWIHSHPEEAREKVRAALSAQTRREMPAELVEAAWSRLHFSDTVDRRALETLMNDAREVGLLRTAIPLDKLLEVSQ